MDTADHLIYLRAHAEGLASLVADAHQQDHLGRTVVTCPDWTVRDLAEHVGGLQRWSAHLVEGPVAVETWRTDLTLTYPESDGEVAAWLAAGLEPMLEVFSNVPPDRRVWVWGADPHARFWPRRMLHEAVVHRADLELSLGLEPAISADLAVDGIDEFLTNLPFTARWGAPTDRYRSKGERLVIRASDTGDTWRLRFHRAGLWWDRGSDKADATLTGLSGDLYLQLQGRERSSVAAAGDPAVIELWRSGLGL